ncbi:MAG TPA: FHA domain-containing protein [Gemmatimonadales bacterium]|nr:FHA domain-containing protein [Gemmatimonadales bacterium]
MMELEVAGQRTPIPVGELVIGTDPSCGLRLGGLSAAHAVVIGIGDGSVAVRRVGENDVFLNGVKLGAEPAPVLHGDKIQVGAHELFVHDPRRSGSTQFVSAGDVARMVAATAKPGAAPKPPTAATGGRLVCLTDGREYTIGSAPLVIGREAGCDIVVPNKDVSRRHAEIFASPQGYVLVDSSTNGTFVNAERVEAQRLLARADVIRIGDHEFRFYADRMPDVPSLVNAPPLAPAPAAPAPPPAPVFTPPPAMPPAAAGAAERLSHTMHGMPPAQPPAPPPAPAPEPPRAAPAPRAPNTTPALATFLVRSGQLKGQRLTVRVPVVNIGRAEYNDLVLPDDSVSGAHAKLQRREGIWVLIDNDSTNGTWVDGERVTGETMLGPGAVVRFGEVSAMFEPTDDHMGTAAGSGTKVMGAMKPSSPAPQPAPVPQIPVSSVPGLPPLHEPSFSGGPTPSAARPAMEAPGFHPDPGVARSARRPMVITSPEKQGMPKWIIPLILVLVLGAVAAFLLTR